MKKIIFLSLLVYLPSLWIFFGGDDWFHLRVAQINSFSEFVNFFSFAKTPQSIAFYRPLPTQVFFFIIQKLFGLNPLPYHLFVLACFGLSLYLVFRLADRLTKSKGRAFAALLIYAFSASNFTRLYFLSAFQEIALVVFSLLCLLSYLEDKNKRAVFYFILALLSKETAIVLPAIMYILDWWRKKISLKRFFPFIVILLAYLYLRLTVFGFTSGDTYRFSLSPAKMVNTIAWYGLWSVGAPEFLVDYIGSGFRPIARFFTDFANWWGIVLASLAVNLLFIGYLLIKNFAKQHRCLLVFGLLFLFSLGPVLFLPEHKFALELGLPLVWFSLCLALLLPEKGKVRIAFLSLFVVSNLITLYLTYPRHYSVGRGKISEKVYRYFSANYPNKPTDSYFEFVNDTKDYGSSWGSSKQIANSTGGSELFRVFYHDPVYQVFFEDLESERPNLERIPISTKMFLQ